MSFNCAMDGISRIQTFNEAKAVFRGTKPVRTWSTNTRPLRKRGESHKLLVERHDSVAARLYNTDMVTWWDDGRVSIARDDHIMSRDFVAAVAPFGLCSHWHGGEFWIRAIHKPGEVAYYQPNHSHELYFQREAGNNWALLNPDDCKRHERVTVNKDKAKEIRAALKPVNTWMQAVNAVSGGDLAALVDGVDFVTVRDIRRLVELHLMDGDLDPDDYPKFLKWAVKRTWHRHSGPTRDLYEKAYLPGNWQQNLAHLCYQTLDAFDRETIPLGELPKKSKWN